jgi:predicted metal-dependent hydrolase
MSLFGRTLADGDRLEVAGAVVRLKVHRRARRVSLRLDRGRGEIVATAPSARRLAEAAAFARERAAWIAERLAELPKPQAVEPGQVIEVFGRPVRLERGSGRARWHEADGDQPARITAMGEGEGFVRAVVMILRRRALGVFTERTAAYAQALGAPMPRVAVMDARTRWGSCKPGPAGSQGTVRYSWRLALAPFAVADYVAAHECAHLIELNHGPRFWTLVTRLVGDQQAHRAWLRAEGARLHVFGRS